MTEKRNMMTLTKAFPVFDGHNDVLLHLYYPELGGGRNFFLASSSGHLDLPRARRGGWVGGFFAIFIRPGPTQFPPAEPTPIRTEKPIHADALAQLCCPPAEPALIKTEKGYERQQAPALDPVVSGRTAMALMARLFRLEEESQGQLKVVRTANELSACLRDGVLASVLHFEGAEPIDPELNALEVFYRAGLRSLGLVWSRPNAFASGVPRSTFPHSPDTGPGLTDAGKELVRACNRLGIMLDLSHLNEQGFWDVAGLSSAPLVATHSNAHAICPTPRNLTDRQLDAIKESDGIVGLNFAVCMLREDGQNEADTPLALMVRHINHLVERMGIDHVGFGSDFDGGKIPQEMGDVTGLPKLVAALAEHGYDEVALRKITHENWLRILRATWREET